MNGLEKFDNSFISFAKKYYSLIARVSLSVIFFAFGFLKIIGASPAGDLAYGFANHMGAGAYAHELFLILAFVECIIGILIILPKMTRLAILMMFAHMMLVCSPLVLYTSAVWQAPFVPNLEGQYIIKKAALVALALGLVSTTRPIRYSKQSRT